MKKMFEKTKRGIVHACTCSLHGAQYVGNTNMARSLKRGLIRIFLVTLLGYLLVHFAEGYPEFFGPNWAALVRGLGYTAITLGFADFLLRLLQPHIDTQECADAALNHNSAAAGLIFFGRCFLYGLIMFLAATASRAAEVNQMPPNAVKYSPLLVSEKTTYWPTLKVASLLGAQVEQETCISLKSKMCWNPQAQLKTSREQGVGFSQLTRTFRADGSIRFDTMADMVNKYPKDLAGLSWSNWSDPKLQMRSLVLMMRDNAKRYTDSATQLDQMAFAFSAYNGGPGSVSNDKLTCRATPGCNPKVWFGNVELTSTKSKTVIPGYGQSPFGINRTYVKNVEVVRRPRYLSLDDKSPA
jgi:hypothetical protein